MRPDRRRGLQAHRLQQDRRQQLVRKRHFESLQAQQCQPYPEGVSHRVSLLSRLPLHHPQIRLAYLDAETLPGLAKAETGGRRCGVMANILEDLYFGNLDPQARGYRTGSHNFRVSKNIAELEEKLTERLQGKDKNLFLDFCNAYGELMGESGLDSFLVGFRLGAKMIFDTFCSDDAPFASYLKE